MGGRGGKREKTTVPWGRLTHGSRHNDNLNDVRTDGHNNKSTRCSRAREEMLFFLRYARLKMAIKCVRWRHTHARIRSLQSVPPCESKVAASRGRRHIELQNEEHRSEKRRSERARERE